MAARIFYQEDCNLSLTGRKENSNNRLWQPGTCTCSELKRVRMRCSHRSVRGKQILGKG